MEAIDLNNLKVFRGKLVDYRRKSSTANGSVMFNDMLGTTQGTVKDGKYSASKSSLFGEFAEQDKDKFFTGKPNVDGIGYAFLFRSYRPELAKWQTSDPLGYPDGFNNFAYCNNGVTKNIDWLGGNIITTGSMEIYSYTSAGWENSPSQAQINLGKTSYQSDPEYTKALKNVLDSYKKEHENVSVKSTTCTASNPIKKYRKLTNKWYYTVTYNVSVVIQYKE